MHPIKKFSRCLPFTVDPPWRGEQGNPPQPMEPVAHGKLKARMFTLEAASNCHPTLCSRGLGPLELGGFCDHTTCHQSTAHGCTNRSRTVPRHSSLIPVLLCYIGETSSQLHLYCTCSISDRVRDIRTFCLPLRPSSSSSQQFSSTP